MKELMTLGIDPSFAGLGYWLRTPSGAVEKGGSIAFKAKGSGARLAQVYEFFEGVVAEHKPFYAVIEGYAFGQRGHRETAGELGGAIRLALYRGGVSGYFVVPPSTLRKFVCGNARKGTGKAEVIAAVKSKWGWDFAGNDDQAEAFALCRAGQALWGTNSPEGSEVLFDKSPWVEL